jgi:NhaP-type Na+/H+ or K+/H+ antiporter
MVCEPGEGRDAATRRLRGRSPGSSRPVQGRVGETRVMEEWALAVVAGIVLLYIALQTWRPWVLAPAIAFTAAGLLVGAEGLGWVDVSPDAGSLKLLAEATLALVLFSDASRIDLRALRDGYGLPARLLGIGLPLTIGAGTLAALVVLPELAVAQAAVLAIVLAATDAALGQAVVTDERLPGSIRQGLNVESGLNDGLCVPALVIAVALAGTQSDALSGSDVARVVTESIGYGVLMGAVAGLAAALVHRRTAASVDEERAQWRWLLSPVAAALAYGLAAPLGGSGFIAAFVAGGVFGAAGKLRRDAAVPLPAQDLGALLNALTFVAFGAAFMKPLIERATWREAIYALLSLTLVRMVPVAIAMLGTRSSAATVSYVGWFGPRGLASIVFAVLVVEADIPGAATIVNATALTVTASIVLHGLSAGPLTGRYVRGLRRGGAPRGGVESAETTVRVPVAGVRWPSAPRA